MTRPTSPPYPGARERIERDNARVPLGGPSPHMNDIRKMEDQRQIDESYKPSEHAHHPAPLNTLMHQERPHDIRSANHSRNSSAPGSAKREPTPPRSLDNHVSERSSPPRDVKKDQDGDVSMRNEEPAARKMDVDENYDDDSGEDSVRSKTKPSFANAAAAGAQAESASPTNGQNGLPNGEAESK